MKQQTRPVVKSAIRAIDVLEFVAAAGKPPAFAEIGAALEIPNSSLFYLLDTLSKRGYLQQNGKAGGYVLGPSLITLANSVSRVSITQIVEPLLEAVWREMRETTSYFERRGDEMECLITKLSAHSLMPVHRVGQKSPLYVFSGGKILLAEMSDDEFKGYIERTELKRWTPSTLMTVEALSDDLAQVRKTGIGISREEHSVGTIGVSVGLRNAGKLVGTLGIAVPAVRFDKAIYGRMVQTLEAAAARCAEALSGSQGAVDSPRD